MNARRLLSTCFLWLIISQSCIAQESGFASPALGLREKVILPIGHRQRALIYTGPSTLVAAVCYGTATCTLQQIDLLPDIELGRAGSEQPFHRFSDGGGLHVLPGGKLAFAHEVMSSATLKSISSLPDGHVVLSREGDEIAINENGKWQIQPITTRQTSQAGAGKLLAFSNQTAVVQDGRALKFLRRADDSLIRSVEQRERCLAMSAPLSDDYFLTSCGTVATIYNYAGIPVLPLGTVAIGYDSVSANQSVSLLLLVRYRQRRGVAKQLQQNALAIMSLGLGVSDEPADIALLQVIRMRDRRVCFQSGIEFQPGNVEPVASLSPDGKQLAIGVAETLSTMALPQECQ